MACPDLQRDVNPPEHRKVIAIPPVGDLHHREIPNGLNPIPSSADEPSLINMYLK